MTNATSTPLSLTRLRGAAAGLLVAFGIVVVVSWVLTVLTANDLSTLLNAELSGAAPASHLAYLGLVAVMMVAMMLPSAIPMLITYRAFSKSVGGRWEPGFRTALFSSAYFLLWSLSMAAALVILMGLGVIGMLTFPWVVAPGLVLVAAGTYQFTSWKERCLSKCRTPFGFLMTNWRSGRLGAFRMGLDHATYCLGCCWLLMAVVFITGAMSLLWMGALSGLILIEKVWGRGELFARALGGASVAVGGVIATAAFVGVVIL